MSDAKKGLHSRYEVIIPILIYKSFETGDIPIIWERGINTIYVQSSREYLAKKENGLDRDYTAEEMNKKFYDLCTDFCLDINGDYIQGTLVVSDF